jgi:hypothetical protein
VTNGCIGVFILLEGSLPMDDFAFKVNIVAVVRVRAADESVARKIVPTVLGSPGTVEIGLANQNNAVVGLDGIVTDVDFEIAKMTRITLNEMARAR